MHMHDFMCLPVSPLLLCPFAVSLPDHYVVINLLQSGKVIATKETKGAAGNNAVWNAPFLFDLPSGDITKLPLTLEFIVMQVTRHFEFRYFMSHVTVYLVSLCELCGFNHLHLFISCRVDFTLKAVCWDAF